MFTEIINKKKRLYNSPEVVCVKLDHEISLVLDSNELPPTFESINDSNAPEFFNNNPVGLFG